MAYTTILFIACIMIATAIIMYLVFRFDRKLRQGALLTDPNLKPEVAYGVTADRASFLMLVGIAAALCVFWAQGNRMLVFHDFTESYGIFLTASNVKDVTTLFLQDVSTGPSPAAHPYLYIHHPNFISRIFSMTGSAFGAGLEEQMLVMSMISVLALGLGFLALRTLVSIEAAFAAVVIVALSYRLFYQHAGDIARAPHYILFWIFMYISSLRGFVSEKWRRTGIGLTAALAATSDWGFFVFFLTFCIAWLLIQNRNNLPVKELINTVFIPASLALGIYFSLIISELGFSFFLNDILTTYLGRSGLQDSPYFTDAIATEHIADYYKDNNVVVWSGGLSKLSIPDFIRDTFAPNPHWFRWIEKRTFVIFFLLFVICRNVSWTRVAILSIALFVSLKGYATPLASLVTVAIAIWIARHPVVDDISRDASKNRYAFGNTPLVQRIRGLVRRVFSSRHHNLINFVVIIAFANMATFAIFPAYYTLLQRSANPPMLLLEMGVLMLVIVVMLVAVNAIRKSPTVPRKIAPFIVASCCLFFVSWFGMINMRYYLLYPPVGVAFASELLKPEYRGKTFISNIDPAVIWYYTKGAAVHGGDVWDAAHPTGHGSPSQVFFSDSKANHNYYYPEYSLCFIGFGNTIDSVKTENMNRVQCRKPTACTCRDISDLLRSKGHEPVHVDDIFSVIRIYYPSRPGVHDR